MSDAASGSAGSSAPPAGAGEQPPAVAIKGQASSKPPAGPNGTVDTKTGAPSGTNAAPIKAPVPRSPVRIKNIAKPAPSAGAGQSSVFAARIQANERTTASGNGDTSAQRQTTPPPNAPPNVKISPSGSRKFTRPPMPTKPAETAPAPSSPIDEETLRALEFLKQGDDPTSASGSFPMRSRPIFPPSRPLAPLHSASTSSNAYLGPHQDGASHEEGDEEGEVIEDGTPPRPPDYEPSRPTEPPARNEHRQGVSNGRRRSSPGDGDSKEKWQHDRFYSDSRRRHDQYNPDDRDRGGNRRSEADHHSTQDRSTREHEDRHRDDRAAPTTNDHHDDERSPKRSRHHDDEYDRSDRRDKRRRNRSRESSDRHRSSRRDKEHRREPGSHREDRGHGLRRDDRERRSSHREDRERRSSHRDDRERRTSHLDDPEDSRRSRTGRRRSRSGSRSRAHRRSRSHDSSRSPATIPDNDDSPKEKEPILSDSVDRGEHHPEPSNSMVPSVEIEAIQPRDDQPESEGLDEDSARSGWSRPMLGAPLRKPLGTDSPRPSDEPGAPLHPLATTSTHTATASPVVPLSPPVLQSARPVDPNERRTAPMLDPWLVDSLAHHDSSMMDVDITPAAGDPAPPTVVGSSPITAYQQKRKLGEGTFGVVSLGVRGTAEASDVKADEEVALIARGLKVRHGDMVALKKIILHNANDGMPITSLREIRLLKALDHPAIVPVVDIAYETGDASQFELASTYMVFPYMDHDLAGLLENPNVHLRPEHIKQYARQLLQGTAYLHQNGLLHRDMKAANLLINNQGKLMIADFGLARSVRKAAQRDGYTNCVVTRWYRPPELLLGEKKYHAPVDMWGVGCVLAEMFHRKPIFPGESDPDQMARIAAWCGAPNEESMPGCSQLPGCEGVKQFKGPADNSMIRNKAIMWRAGKTFGDLLAKILLLDPNKRLTAIEALQHEWFWVEPFPTDPEAMPLWESSHEMDKRKREEDHRVRGPIQAPSQMAASFPPPGLPPQHIAPSRPPPGPQPGYRPPIPYAPNPSYVPPAPVMTGPSWNRPQQHLQQGAGREGGRNGMVNMSMMSQRANRR